MDKKRNLEYGILNVAASPHPEGVYVDLLNKAALERVNFFGDLYATISKPELVEDGYYRGRVVIWTEIDKTLPAINKDQLEQIEFENLDLKIPDNVGFNGRIFTYVLREKDHLFFIETKNDLGKKLSIRRLQRIFEKLFSEAVQGVEAPFVEVTVVPESDALSRILKVYELKKLKIHIVRPNADDLDTDRLLARMEKQGAKKQEILLVAAPNSGGIKADEETKTQAKVAATNGYVVASGLEEDGQTVELSTKDYPKLIRRRISERASVFSAILAVAKETFIKTTVN